MLDHLVILGGGFAGSLAAIACAGRARRITIVERHPQDGTGEAMGAPQSHHVHIFSGRGQSLIDTLVPGILDELGANGASYVDWVENTVWETNAGPYPRYRSGVSTLLFSRKLLNRLLWARVMALPNVTVVRAAVREIVFADGLVAELHLGDGTSLKGADFYVDARGRSSPIKGALEAVLGPIPSREIRNTLRYTTAVIDRTEGEKQGDIRQYYRKSSATSPLGYYASEIEGGKLLFTVVDYFGTENAPFARFAAHPALAGRNITRTKSFAKLHNVHAQYGKARRWIGNLAVLGDAVCHLNPVYAHGLTLATEHVALLVRALDDARPTRAHHLQRAIDASIAPRWDAVAIDEMRAPHAPFALKYALYHAIADTIEWAAFRSRTVHRRMFEVFHGTVSPLVLILPATWMHVAFACFRALVAMLTRSSNPAARDGRRMAPLDPHLVELKTDAAA